MPLMLNISAASPLSADGALEKRQALITALGGAALFAICFTIFSSMRMASPFLDETNNFSLGVQIANGRELYKDVFEQHTPIMYWISAVMSKCGVRTLLEFRLAWYALLSVCYVLVYFRYSKHLGRTGLFLWPTFYLLSITTVELGTTVLAEQLVAICIVVLALEFMLFYKRRTMPASSAVCIALSIDAAFLAAFVSAFASAAAVIGVIVIEIIYVVKQKYTFKQGMAYFFGKYALVIALTLAPLIGIVIYYALKGLLARFIFCIYTFNVEVYSGYLGGYGQNPITAVTSSVQAYIEFIKTVIQTFFQGADKVSLIIVLLQFFMYVWFLLLACKKKLGVAAVLFIMFMLSGTRGFDNFHALQTLSFTAFASAMLLGGLIASRGIKGAVAAALSCAVIISGGAYTWQRRNFLYPTANEFNIEYEAHSYEALIQKLTQPGELVMENVSREDLYLHTHALEPSYNVSQFSWWWDALKDEAMQAIKASPPRIVVFSPDYTAWGYTVKDYAPEMVSFINENYTRLYDDAPWLLVRNDCYDEIKAEMPDDEGMVNCITADVAVPSIEQGSEAAQVFTAQRGVINEISLQFGTHNTKYDGTVNVSLAPLTSDGEKGDAIFEATINGSDILDNAYKQILTESIPVTAGEQYVITVTTQPLNGSLITLWADEDAASPDCYGIYNGEKQTYNYMIKVR